MLPVVLSLLLKTDTNNFETGRLFTITRKNVNNSYIFLKGTSTLLSSTAILFKKHKIFKQLVIENWIILVLTTELIM